MAGAAKKKMGVAGWLGAYAVVLLVMGMMVKSIYLGWGEITRYCNLGAYILFTLALGVWIYSIITKAKVKAKEQAKTQVKLQAVEQVRPQATEARIKSREDLSEQIGELFKNLDLKGGANYPSLYKKSIQNREETYYYHLPAGLTLSDINQKKEAFEQYLNHKIKVHIEDRMIVIKVLTKY